ncbi:VOC family protein [Ferrovibrio sp.]|uniref:VOC family protein n=1 Tax=Ferrovibrio sp. TaxID=1917215 RepID=UPI001B7A149A|nr:VOC family protein [Ferrovibrio sp.]MBP7062633.1 VOC family protein [Ferrovibrio sp.]
MTTPPSIFPFLRYRDATAAMAWLQLAFGFRVALQVPGANGGIAHAELQLGHGMVMLGDQSNDALGLALPQAGPGNQGIYIVVPDVDALYARAKAAGAQIVIDLHDTDYGSRDFSCRDPEGQLWSIGSYQPPMLPD